MLDPVGSNIKDDDNTKTSLWPIVGLKQVVEQALEKMNEAEPLTKLGTTRGVWMLPTNITRLKVKTAIVVLTQKDLWVM